MAGEGLGLPQTEGYTTSAPCQGGGGHRNRSGGSQLHAADYVTGGHTDRSCPEHRWQPHHRDGMHDFLG